jgi:LmbE family N-acetylglucosaminyl deacetylase
MARAAEAGAEVMVVSATRGERGQIRNAAAATRRTLGAVREGELCAAAAELGVQRVQVLAYADGTLQQHRFSLGAAIADIMRQFDPDTVITFGADGGYGHPDHVAISELTTEAFLALVRDHNRGQRLYHAVFPPRRTSMAEELTHWIVNSGQRATDHAALQAIALFAGESATMRLARDHVRVEWFPPGIYVVEQGEPADELYLILNGTAARHRTQYPIVPSMLPQRLLEQMLGTEFFRRTADGSEPQAVEVDRSDRQDRPRPGRLPALRSSASATRPPQPCDRPDGAAGGRAPAARGIRAAGPAGCALTGGR